MQLVNIKKPAVKLSAIALALMAHHASAAVDCSGIPQWQAGQVYTSGQQVQQDNIAYRANWWNRSSPKLRSGQWQEWRKLGECLGDEQPNQSPVIDMELPGSDMTVKEGEKLQFVFSAHDSDGIVRQVSVYHNDALVKVLDEAPYVLNWKARVGGSRFPCCCN